ncbi:hypothetical protein GCM10009780_11810 [Actinomadura alba]
MKPRRPGHPITVVLVLAAAYLLYLAVPNIGFAIRAADADGRPGVFTAQRLQCVRHTGHESCSWTGEFRSDDARTRRAEVSLYGSRRDTLRSGEQTRAFDIGRPNRVYRPEGSREWVAVAMMVLLGMALFLCACVRLRRRQRTEMGSKERTV